MNRRFSIRHEKDENENENENEDPGPDRSAGLSPDPYSLPTNYFLEQKDPGNGRHVRKPDSLAGKGQ